MCKHIGGCHGVAKEYVNVVCHSVAMLLQKSMYVTVWVVLMVLLRNMYTYEWLPRYCYGVCKPMGGC